MNNSAMPFKGRPQAIMAATRPENDSGLQNRRPPPNHSLSLLHAKRRSSPIDSDSSQKSPGTDSPSSLLPGKESSGESSNAEKWFDKSNNEVHEHSTSFADDEPPFFMPQSSSSDTPPELAAAKRQTFDRPKVDAESLPKRAGLTRFNTDGSSTDGYRGVIDDLTRENKKLRQRLKKAEQYRISPLKHEKLFEVRTSGLHGAQKRELEQILKQFAERVDNESVHPVGDSAYQSNSLSGEMTGSGSRNSARPEQSAGSRGVSITNFLSKLPEFQTHLKDPSTMTDREKKEAVVDKLEEIFVGRIASGGRHLQPMQQQEVSDLAGQEDRDTNYSHSLPHRSEGPREAHMLPRRTTGAASHDRDRAFGATPPQTSRDGNSDAPEKALPEQRPTKPIDLDPQRAQNPLENVRYISHLGFSPIDLSSRTPQEDNHGWIYLNVLINMAQLHSLSVTVDFMRKALSEYRSKFEFSSDGQMVRWIGSGSASRSGAESTSTRDELGTPNLPSPRKRQRRARTHPAHGKFRSQTHEYDYTPLLVPRHSSASIDSSADSDGDSVWTRHPALQNGDSSAMTSSGMATGAYGATQLLAQKKRKIQDDGPMIFYKSSPFITDLSGVHNPLEDLTPGPPRIPASGVPVGLPRNLRGSVAEKRGPLATTAELPEPMDLADNPIPASEELSFPTQSSSASETDHVKPVQLEVTGIGGVWPADNFAIAVRSCQVPIENATKQEQTFSKNIPSKFVDLLAKGTKRGQPPVRQHRVVSFRRKDLPPSELPPALGYMPGDDDGSEEDESAGEEESDDLHWGRPASDGFGPSAALQPLHPPYGSSDEEDDDDDMDDDDQDSNIDMLATARKFDPEGVRRAELAYADTAERFAQEIPAGSSAATAGGGSGLNTPGQPTSSYKSNVSAGRLKMQLSSDTVSS